MDIFNRLSAHKLIDWHLERAIHFCKMGNSALSTWHENKADLLANGLKTNNNSYSKN